MPDSRRLAQSENISAEPQEINVLRCALQRPLPGLAGQMAMMPRPRPGMERLLDPTHRPREGSVLVLLYPHAGALALVLTKRTETLNLHSGQISFPGGAHEPSDGGFEQTALREAFEELGIRPDSVTILGALTPLYIPPSDYRIYPIVAFTPQRPDFRPAPREVETVLEMPLAELLSGRTVRVETWLLRGQPVEVPYFDLAGHKVWGATAMVLSELRQLLCNGAPHGAISA